MLFGRKSNDGITQAKRAGHLLAQQIGKAGSRTVCEQEAEQAEAGIAVEEARVCPSCEPARCQPVTDCIGAESGTAVAGLARQTGVVRGEIEQRDLDAGEPSHAAGRQQFACGLLEFYFALGDHPGEDKSRERFGN